MWCEIISGAIVQTVQDTDPITTADGMRYPSAWDKSTIPNLVAVVLAPPPDPAQFTITGSTVALVNGVPTQTITTAPIPLGTVQAAQYAAINAGANVDLGVIIAAYPELEVATWDQQLAEAQAFTASNTAATPLLSAISSASGLSLAALSANVLAKNAAYKAASGAIVGKRLALSAQIAAATTAAAVQAVVWN
jgi:hypothetical protein